MKKFIPLLFVLIGIYNPMSAQTGQGGFLISGATSFSYGNRTEKETLDGDQIGNDNKISSIQFNPTAGYFLIDNLAAGITLWEEFSNRRYETDNGINYSYKNNLLLVGPIARYYYDLGSFKPFAQADVLLGKSTYTEKADNFSVETSEKAFGFGLGVGGAYFINDNISIDALLGYSFLNFTDNDDTDRKSKRSEFKFSFGFSVYF